MKIDVNNPCCICNSHESKILFETEYPNHNYPGMFRIRKCQSCGLLFNSPRLTDTDLSKLYGKNYYFFNRNDSDEFKRITDIYLRTVAMLQGEIKRKKVLEIGSAKGYLLVLLKQLGWGVQGVELSTEASNYARLNFDINTFNGTVKEYVKSNFKEKFPFILAIDVLEHVPDPIKFIQCIDSILEDDGVLIIDTPNGKAKNIEIAGSEWKGFNPFHIYLFSIDNLKYILENMGYAVEISFSYGNSLQEKKINNQGNLNHNRRINSGSVSKEKLKSILSKFKLLDFSKNLYVKFQKYTDIEEEHKSLLTNAMKVIEESPLYSNTEDAHEELAKKIKGDNIVMIARKCV